MLPRPARCNRVEDRAAVPRRGPRCGRGGGNAEAPRGHPADARRVRGGCGAGAGRPAVGCVARVQPAPRDGGAWAVGGRPGGRAVEAAPARAGWRLGYHSRLARGC